jgi:hypothetical protein
MSDLPDVRLVVRRRCDVCEGTGEIDSEGWADLRSAEERLGRSIDPEEFFLDTRHEDSVPPMKRECGACEEGWATDDLAVEDLADAILARVPTAVIPRAELDELVETVKRSITAAALKSEGLADADDAGSWLRAVQEGAEALRAVTDLLVRRDG